MNKKILKSTALAAAAILGATIVWAVPPPVPQNGFVKDTSFTYFVNADCTNMDCHGLPKDPLAKPLVYDAPKTHEALTRKHHALLTTNKLNIVPSCYNVNQTLPASLTTGCHLLTGGAAIGGGINNTVITDVTDCKSCHTRTPHHATTWAAAQDCVHCHGSAIDNPGDGHYIPTYFIDMNKGGITPSPKGRYVPDPNDPTKTIIVQGCEACHQDNKKNAAFPIFSSVTNHHNTLLGQGAVGKCTWCHDAASSKNIRACEACHGVKSLHNIQWDTNNASSPGVIKPGAEDPGFGHTGSNFDCWGCHSGWGGTGLDDIPIKATTPTITDLSTSTVTLGQAATLTITGNGFTNTASGTSGATFNPVVTIAVGTGSIKLTPVNFTQNEITVTIPTTLPVGVYELRVEKPGVVSNLQKLVVVPAPPVLATALASNTSVTITGKGFGEKPPAYTTGLMGVFVNGVPVKSILAWSNTKIIATAAAKIPAGAQIKVKGLYGSGVLAASAPIKK